MNRYVLLAALCATLAAGCSTNTANTAANDEDDKVVVTGSRIPVKDKTAATKTTDRNSIDDFSRQQRVFVPGASGTN